MVSECLSNATASSMASFEIVATEIKTKRTKTGLCYWRCFALTLIVDCTSQIPSLLLTYHRYRRSRNNSKKNEGDKATSRNIHPGETVPS